MLCRFEMFVPHFLVEFERYVTNTAFKGPGSCIGCLRVIDAALRALVAEEGADIRHGIGFRAKEWIRSADFWVSSSICVWDSTFRRGFQIRLAVSHYQGYKSDPSSTSSIFTALLPTNPLLYMVQQRTLRSSQCRSMLGFGGADIVPKSSR